MIIMMLNWQDIGFGGMSCSIGNNWMQKKGEKALPILSSAGQGINRIKDKSSRVLQKAT